MNNEAIQAVSALDAMDAAAASSPAKAAPGAVQKDFSAWFAGELSAVNDKLVSSEQGLRQLAAGESVSLHEVMMRAEEAKLSFQLLVQVRNRVLEAYQEVMRMQA